MDMPPPPALQAFADVPAVVQARGAPSPLLVDAVKAMSDARALTVTLPPPARPGAAVPDREPSAVEPIRIPDYEALVTSMRARVARDIPPLPDFDITMLDNGGAGAVADAKAHFGPESVAARTFAAYYGMKGNSPFSSYIPVNSKAKSCVIMGAPPTMTMADMKATAYGGNINVGSATARDFQGWANNHELGHCLLGPNETSADVFGMLVMIHDGADRDLIASISAIRESNELLSPNNNDDYFVTAAAGWLARNYDRIRADRKFMESDTARIARYAKGVSDRFQIDDMTKSDHKMMRLVLVAAQKQPFHFVNGLDGRPRKTDFDGWLAANAKKVPLFARVLDLKRRLAKGPEELPAPFAVDGPGTMMALAKLVAAGDPTAKAMMDTATRTGFPPPLTSPLKTAYDFPDAHGDAERLFDREAPPTAGHHVRVSVVEPEEAPSFRQ